MRVFLAGLAGLTVTFAAWAETERVIDFQYDRSGNIVRMTDQQQSDAPAVASIDPTFINIGRTVLMTANGTGLLGV